MSTIQIDQLTFRYPGADAPVFDKLSLNLDTTWRLGLIGRNGRGKTTFMNLLRGQLSGHGLIKSPVTFNYFPDAAINRSQTVMAIMTSTGAEEWQASLELDRIGLDESYEQRLFDTLSGGEQTRVLLARGFVNENDFPLIDEPTNHLDIEGRQVVGTYLRQKQGFICVSHDESFLNLFVDHVMSLNRSSVDLVAGNVENWQVDKERRDNAATTQNEHLQHRIKQLSSRANIQREWAEKRERESNDASSRRMAKKLMSRAKVFEHRTDAAIEQRKGLMNDVDQVDRLRTNVQQTAGGQLLFSLRDFSVKRQNGPLFQPVSLDFHRGDRLAILGPNGVGKTSFLNLLRGQEKLAYDGYLMNDLPQDIGYLSQQFTDFIMDGSFDRWRDHHDETTVWNLMHQLGVSRPRLKAPTSEWSMGEMKKAALAVSLSEPHEILVWDEPTNYLDIDAREQLQTLIQQVRPTMVLIDHDRHFIEETCTQQMTLNKFENKPCLH
ncbi:ATP-binding cassette domain-containing protein [Furfurilactobacillus rossiae]|uniref:ABC superfamily ATP binding cassette transporter, ABC protein n=1 Tax=Furfurilactobacillus rossiae DSM 15814 TaxID=1114972 RepID=A0A0R1RHP2_9LACO|nr:ATP-binding cassette domain-containing protein [Furfurilactobacillus rossiae]KRL53765.1 ABC superfamily ATP binding cassette transporter, ABC protein [Furfurilactobacillus rossiae DSM 15814]QFR66706.1 ATP-binding cassette domain-containing protein [Furfurilactobacillus rossiae]QLE62183.1 ABC transporter [Furfurilactobacillus rossiae]